jgi:hypothetical protein
VSGFGLVISKNINTDDYTNSKALTFFQGGIASNKRHKSSDNRRTTINLGIGHRLLVEDDNI